MCAFTKTEHYGVFLDRRRHGNTRALLAIGLAEIAWGVTLLSGNTTMEGEYYSIMLDVMPSQWWAVLFTIVGCIQWVLAFCGSCAPTFSTIGTGTSVLLWWFVVVSAYSTTVPPTVLVVGCLVVAVTASWVFISSEYKDRDGSSTIAEMGALGGDVRGTRGN